MSVPNQPGGAVFGGQWDHFEKTVERFETAWQRGERPVLDDYQEKVREILTPEQEAEWEKMRVEARDRLKERYRAGQEPD